MEERHETAAREARLAAARVEAGTESAECVCGTCAIAISAADEDQTFVCGKCSERICDERRHMTECVACAEKYCDNCLGNMNTQWVRHGSAAHVLQSQEDALWRLRER